MNLPFHFRALSTVSTTSSALRGGTNTIVGQVQMSGEEDSIRTSWFRIKVEKDAMSASLPMSTNLTMLVLYIVQFDDSLCRRLQ